jgi:hypothetical protein
MPKYTILTSSICTTRYTVEADNEDQAKEAVYEADIIEEEFINFADEFITDVTEEN